MAIFNSYVSLPEGNVFSSCPGKTITGEDSVSAQASGRELPLTSCGHKTNTVAGRLELAQPGEPQNN